VETQGLEKVGVVDGTRLEGQLLCIQICLDREYSQFLPGSERSQGGLRAVETEALKEHGNVFADRSSLSLWLHCNDQDVPLQLIPHY
jgi:hypothetical protein